MHTLWKSKLRVLELNKLQPSYKGKREREDDLLGPGSSKRGRTHDPFVLDTKINTVDDKVCFAKSEFATTSFVPPKQNAPSGGLESAGSLNKLYMTRHGFDPRYWTNDETEIEELKNSNAPTLCILNPDKNLTSYNTFVDIKNKTDDTVKEQIQKAIDGDSFVLTTEDEEYKLAFKYNMWFDGMLMSRKTEEDMSDALESTAHDNGFVLTGSWYDTHGFPSNLEALTRVDEKPGVEKVSEDTKQDWINDNFEKILKSCGWTEKKGDAAYKKELENGVEYVYSAKYEHGTEPRAFLLMKTNPTIRDKEIKNTLYIELVCTKELGDAGVRGCGKMLVGLGGIADAVASKLHKENILLSSVYRVDEIYKKWGFEPVTFDTIRAWTEEN